jgi:hypothetical protein
MLQQVGLIKRSVGTKEQCQVEISNKFAPFENLDDNVDISRDWELL